MEGEKEITERDTWTRKMSQVFPEFSAFRKEAPVPFEMGSCSLLFTVVHCCSPTIRASEYSRLREIWPLTLTHVHCPNKVIRFIALRQNRQPAVTSSSHGIKRIKIFSIRSPISGSYLWKSGRAFPLCCVRNVYMSF